MNEKSVSQAVKDMEGILGGLEKIMQKPFGWCSLLPETHPKLISRGDTALVLTLRGDLVGKVTHYQQNPEHHGSYLLLGLYVGKVPHIMERTVTALKEMGFQNVLDHVEIQRYPDVEAPNEIGPRIAPYYYHLSPDLREGEKYDVYSIEKFPFDDIGNGQELKEQMEQSLDRIKFEILSGKYVLEVDRHATKDKPDEALRKMFIGRVNRQTNQGELFFADLDHCVIYQN